MAGGICLLYATVAPELETGLKAAFDVGKDARLPCVASGAPHITFTWSRVSNLSDFHTVTV